MLSTTPSTLTSLLAAGALAAFAAPAAHASVTPDGGFGSGGFVSQAIGSHDVDAYGAAPLPGGGVVVAGTAYPKGRERFAVTRLDAGGAPVSSFGTNGTVTLSVGEVSARATSVAVQPDGKIVAVGAVDDVGAVHTRWALARLNPDGTPDATFAGGAGVEAVYVGDYAATGQGNGGAEDVVLDAAGNIVVAGKASYAAHGGMLERPIVARFTPDGALDRSFGGVGWTSVADFTFDSEAEEVSLGPDGSIYLGEQAYGSYGSRPAVTKLRSSGAIDRSYGTDGTGVFDVSGAEQFYRGGTVAVQPDGSAVVAGGGRVGDYGALMVGRLTPGGVEDHAFGLLHLTGSVGADASGAAVTASGEVVVTGVVDSDGVVVSVGDGSLTVVAQTALGEPRSVTASGSRVAVAGTGWDGGALVGLLGGGALRLPRRLLLFLRLRLLRPRLPGLLLTPPSRSRRTSRCRTAHRRVEMSCPCGLRRSRRALRSRAGSRPSAPPSTRSPRSTASPRSARATSAPSAGGR